jgi:hypothetical protein
VSSYDEPVPPDGIFNNPIVGSVEERTLKIQRMKAESYLQG